MMRLENKAFQLLRDENKTLAIAESCTGGLLSHSLTNIPGSSKVFMGAVIAYDNRIKTKLLNVPVKILSKHGSVSAVVASQMANHVRKSFKTDFGVGITGIAGPGGGSSTKPVGLVFLSVSSKEKTVTKKFIFIGSRLAIKKQAAHAALKICCAMLD